MDSITLGRSGLPASPVCRGTMTFGAAQVEQLDAAIGAWNTEFPPEMLAAIRRTRREMRDRVQ